MDNGYENAYHDGNGTGGAGINQGNGGRPPGMWGKPPGIRQANGESTRHVATIEDIRAVSNNPRLLAFAEFVIGSAGGRAFPDYRKIDLMEIAPLVRFVWVLDFTGGIDNRPQFVFSGTHVDDHYGMNITGKCFEEIYVEPDFDQAITGNYYQVCVQKKVAYTKRLAHYFDDVVDRYKSAEAIMFPCSGNGKDIDYGLAFIEYSSTTKAPEQKVFKLL